MRTRHAIFALLAAIAASAVADRIPVDPADAAAAATRILQRSEHLKPMLEEVHPSDWVAKGAPDAYVSQWRSLTEQNQAVATEMSAIAQSANAQPGDQDSSLEPLLKALFRVHRFDGDLDALLKAVRRYQNPALADLIESVAVGDQAAVEKLQEYAIDRAAEKDRRFDLVDKEAQRCRAALASQPVNRPGAPCPGGQGKTTK